MPWNLSTTPKHIVIRLNLADATKIDIAVPSGVWLTKGVEIFKILLDIAIH